MDIELNLKLPLKPCPHCANTKLYKGYLSAMSFGVQCFECGAKLELHVPDKYPRGINSFEDLFVYTYERSIENWNKRETIFCRTKRKNVNKNEKK